MRGNRGVCSLTYSCGEKKTNLTEWTFKYSCYGLKGIKHFLVTVQLTEDLFLTHVQGSNPQSSDLLIRSSWSSGLTFSCVGFCSAATEEPRRICGLREPPQPSLQKVREERLRVHTNGCG